MRFYILFFALLFSSISFGQKQWTLQECVAFAMDNNITIQQAELSEDLAEIGLKQSKGSMMPNLNASASHNYNWGRNIDPITNSITTERIQRNSFGINSNMALFNGFQRYNSMKQSEINISAVQAQNEMLRNDISLNIANSFLNVLFNREFYSIALLNLEATQKQVEQTEKLFNAGSVPEGSLFEVQAQLASDEAALLNSKNNVDLAKLILIQLMQIPDTNVDNFGISVPEIEDLSIIQMPTDIDVIIQNAVNSFPSMKVSEANVEFNQMSVKIADGARLPNLNLNYSLGTGYSDQNIIGMGDLVSISSPIGTVSTTGDEVISYPQTFYSDFDTKPFNDQFNDNINHGLSLSLSVPIFNGWNVDGNIQRAKINLMTSELEMKNTRNNLIQDIERSWADAEVASKNYEAAIKTVDASQKAYDYAEIQFNEGVINQLDFNQSRIRLDNAKTDMIRNKYDYIFKVKVLDFYQGKPITF